MTKTKNLASRIRIERAALRTNIISFQTCGWNGGTGFILIVIDRARFSIQLSLLPGRKSLNRARKRCVPLEAFQSKPFFSLLSFYYLTLT